MVLGDGGRNGHEVTGLNGLNAVARGEKDGDFRAFTFFGADFDLSAMQIDKRFGNRKPKARALLEPRAHRDPFDRWACRHPRLGEVDPAGVRSAVMGPDPACSRIDGHHRSAHVGILPVEGIIDGVDRGHRGAGGAAGIVERRRRDAVSYTHLRAHETVLDIVCRLLLEKKKNTLYD